MEVEGQMMTDKKWIEMTLGQAQMTEFAKRRVDALDAMKAGSGLADAEWQVFKGMFEFAYAAGVRDTLSHCPLVRALLAKAMNAEVGVVQETDRRFVSIIESEGKDETQKADDEARVQPEGTGAISEAGAGGEVAQSC